MGSVVARLAEGEYVLWSSIVDAPTSYILDRTEAVTEWGEASVARADKNGTSSRLTHGLASLIEGNRAGVDGVELTLEQLRKKFIWSSDADADEDGPAAWMGLAPRELTLSEHEKERWEKDGRTVIALYPVDEKVTEKQRAVEIMRRTFDPKGENVSFQAVLSQIAANHSGPARPDAPRIGGDSYEVASWLRKAGASDLLEAFEEANPETKGWTL